MTTSLAQALAHGKSAVAFDSENNIAQAVESYDLALLFLDEVLVQLPRSSELFAQLVNVRDDYDDRMEWLRITYSDSSNHKHQQQPAGGKASWVTSHRKKRQSQVNFEVDEGTPTAYVDSPRSLIQVPYHQMRVVKQSIEEGAFLTPTVYCPKSVWNQISVKFSGLSVKTSAFQDVVSIVRQHVPPLPPPTDAALDVAALRALQVELKAAHGEMTALQSQLSKPFPFIRDVVQHDAAATAAKSSSSKGQVARFTSMVTSLGKSVMTMAETQYQRLGTIATHVTDEDFQAYVALTTHLCEVCQALDGWRQRVEADIKALRPSAAPSEGECDKATAPESSSSSSSSSSGSSSGSSNSGSSEETSSSSSADAADAAKRTERLDQLQDVHVLLSIIAVFMRDVVCEILLQDVEYLVLRYMQKSMKNLQSMFWDDLAAEED